MDYQSAMLILTLVSEGVGVAREIAELAQRVLDGAEVSKDEILAAQAEVRDAVAEWDGVSGVVADPIPDTEPVGNTLDPIPEEIVEEEDVS